MQKLPARLAHLRAEGAAIAVSPLPQVQVEFSDGKAASLEKIDFDETLRRAFPEAKPHERYGASITLVSSGRVTVTCAGRTVESDLIWIS